MFMPLEPLGRQSMTILFRVLSCDRSYREHLRGGLLGYGHLLPYENMRETHIQ